MIVMKYIQHSPAKVFAELRKYKDLIKALLQNKEGEDLLETTTIYISKTPNTDMETIIDNFTEIEEIAGVVAKSAREKEMEKGKEKGIEKGILLEKAKNALLMLTKKTDINFIIEITKLSNLEIKMLVALYNKFSDKAIEHIEITDGKVCMK